MRNETGIEDIPFKCIPIKSPDVSPMDKCEFALLKESIEAVSQKIGYLWKIVVKEFNIFSLNILKNLMQFDNKM